MAGGRRTSGGPRRDHVGVGRVQPPQAATLSPRTPGTWLTMGQGGARCWPATAMALALGSATLRSASGRHVCVEDVVRAVQVDTPASLGGPDVARRRSPPSSGGTPRRNPSRPPLPVGAPGGGTRASCYIHNDGPRLRPRTVVRSLLRQHACRQLASGRGRFASRRVGGPSCRDLGCRRTPRGESSAFEAPGISVLMLTLLVPILGS